MSRETFTHTHTDNKKRVRRTWYVKRLWELSAKLPVKAVPVESISALDEVTWFDMDPSQHPTGRRVADHAKRIYETNFDYPIILSAEGWVMDGMHRICKAYILGMECIDAIQFEQNPDPDETVESEV